MFVLAVNIGSTSYKYRLYQMGGEQVLAQGRFERIGAGNPDCPDYQTAIRRSITDIAGPEKPLPSLDQLGAIAFKAVHAGPVTGARVVDDAVLQAMEEFAFLAPAHNPAYIAALMAFRATLPNVPLVALFETSFFVEMSEAATTYAVPYHWRSDFGVRRYGFHGASHRAASEFVRDHLRRNDLRHISCHLGGSSSLAAIRNGVAVDTTFGISPQSGLPQNNRVGDIDAFAVLFVMKKLGLGVDEVAAILNTKSGLAGISGGSGDVRDLEKAAEQNDTRAQLALDVLARAVRHAIGAFFVELGGVDVITFSGGIGENSSKIRAEICGGLGPLGVSFDEEWNRCIERRGVISRDDSPVKVLVVPADEEIIVARAAASLISGRPFTTPTTVARELP
jgi:acetate kinase